MNVLLYKRNTRCSELVRSDDNTAKVTPYVYDVIAYIMQQLIPLLWLYRRLQISRNTLGYTSPMKKNKQPKRIPAYRIQDITSLWAYAWVYHSNEFYGVIP